MTTTNCPDCETLMNRTFGSTDEMEFNPDCSNCVELAERHIRNIERKEILTARYRNA